MIWVKALAFESGEIFANRLGGSRGWCATALTAKHLKGRIVVGHELMEESVMSLLRPVDPAFPIERHLRA